MRYNNAFKKTYLLLIAQDNQLLQFFLFRWHFADKKEEHMKSSFETPQYQMCDFTEFLSSNCILWF